MNTYCDFLSRKSVNKFVRWYMVCVTQTKNMPLMGNQLPFKRYTQRCKFGFYFKGNHTKLKQLFTFDLYIYPEILARFWCEHLWIKQHHFKEITTLKKFNCSRFPIGP